MKTDFITRVLEIVKNIPKGQTLTYGQVAAQAGSPRAARVVGLVMSKNWDPNIPCHRVVRTDGSVGGYNRGRENKTRLLLEEAEEVRLEKSKRSY